MKRKIRKLMLAGSVLLMLVIALAWSIGIGVRLQDDMAAHIARVVQGDASPTGERTPGELIRYARARLAGHPKLEFFLLPVLDVTQPYFERPIPSADFRRFGKGQRQDLLLSGNATYRVGTVAELEDALRQVREGEVIELLPGKYQIRKTLYPRNAGQAEQRIVLRAERANTAILEIEANEGFAVTKPYWTFENLKLVGVCQNHEYCEHAFHVSGEAHHTIIRNNHIEDFSAHIKVNGLRGNWPDDGNVSFNNLVNSKPRNTSRPVTPFDLVGASRWVVSDNYVANFTKSDPKSTTFGIFMKGAGFGGRIERNLVVCATRDMSQAGTRVGISFGGGGSGKSYCRDGACEVEFSGGRAFNNIVAHCNDFGIDVNRSRATFIAHNTLINTGGIDVRGDGASALAYGNLFEGLARARNGGSLQKNMNENVSLLGVFESVDELRLQWKERPGNIASHPAVTEDFCGRPRSEGTPPGALEAAGPCG